jgi:hypothetical protein
MDEGRDGGGDHSGGGFCADSVAPNTPRQGGGPADRNPEDYKRVTVTVAWSERNRTYQQSQTAIVNNPGSIAGPAIRTLTLLGNTASPVPHIVDDAGDGLPSWNLGPAQQVTVHFTTSLKPASTNWLLDGAIQTPAPGPYDGTGKAFAITWNYSALVDGTYVIGAEAYDKYGVAGPGRSLSVTLNRYLPAKVKNLAGGKNNGVVELEWSANTERDIIGYTVEREDIAGSGIWAQVCPLIAGAVITETSCTDDVPAPGSPRYRVRAWDSAPDGSARPSDQYSDILTVPAVNAEPNQVTELTGVNNGDGTVTLTWKRPDPTDPDGDAIDFYRIYRDGTAVGDRYSRWYDSGQNVTWTDTTAGGVGHTYYVTAVDTNYAESDPVGVNVP